VLSLSGARRSTKGSFMNAKLIRRALIVLSFALSLCGKAIAQDDVLGSAAGSALGVKSSKCDITVYSTYDCGPCQQLARTLSGPDYSCNNIQKISCGSYRNPDQRNCPGIFSFPTAEVKGGRYTGVPSIMGALAQCKCGGSDPKPPTDPRPKPPTQPDPPSPPTGRCTGQAKIECPNKTGIACCLVGCDKTTSNGCINCPPYRPCSASSCSAGKTCVNKKDSKGCLQNFTCEDPSPPSVPCPDECSPGQQCVDGVCSAPPAEPPVEPQPCDSPADCQPGMTCENGECTKDGNPPVDPPPACTGDDCDPVEPPQPPVGRCPRKGEPSYLSKECSNGSALSCCRVEEGCGADGATCTPKGSGGGSGGSVCIGGRCGF